LVTAVVFFKVPTHCSGGVKFYCLGFTAVVSGEMCPVGCSNHRILIYGNRQQFTATRRGSKTKILGGGVIFLKGQKGYIIGKQLKNNQSKLLTKIILIIILLKNVSIFLADPLLNESPKI